MPAIAYASSHREAPLISRDPQADNVDTYAFVSPDNPGTVTVICTYLPLQEPAGGPNFYQFGEGMEYNMLVDNDGDARPDVQYRFDFTTVIPNGNTFLYATGPITSLDDPDYNIRQSYSVTKTVGRRSEVITRNRTVPPVNIGPTSTPNYESLSNAGIYTLPDGTRVFAGQADDPFFVDLGGTFDLVTIRDFPGNNGGGVDGPGGYNVLALAMQIPAVQLKSAESPVIGVWCNAQRSKITVLSGFGAAPQQTGPRVQVSRLGMPLVNELLIPLSHKDRFNATEPRDDAQFANFITDPELGRFFASIGVAVPPQGPLGTPAERDDLKAVFLTGIPGLNQLPSVHLSEMIRLNTSIAPSATPSRLGVLGGDLAGFPNGRRLTDDVVDIELRAVAGATYPLFHPAFTPDPAAGVVGDGVDANDRPFRPAFPYLAVANGGFESVPHQGAAQNCSASASAILSDPANPDEYCFVVPEVEPEEGIDGLIKALAGHVLEVVRAVVDRFSPGAEQLLHLQEALFGVVDVFSPSDEESADDETAPEPLIVSEEPEFVDIFGDAGEQSGASSASSVLEPQEPEASSASEESSESSAASESASSLPSSEAEAASSSFASDPAEGADEASQEETLESDSEDNQPSA